LLGRTAKVPENDWMERFWNARQVQRRALHVIEQKYGVSVVDCRAGSRSISRVALDCRSEMVKSGLFPSWKGGLWLALVRTRL
jgi:hypothetical protein